MLSSKSATENYPQRRPNRRSTTRQQEESKCLHNHKRRAITFVLPIKSTRLLVFAQANIFMNFHSYGTISRRTKFIYKATCISRSFTDSPLITQHKRHLERYLLATTQSAHLSRPNTLYLFFRYVKILVGESNGAHLITITLFSRLECSNYIWYFPQSHLNSSCEIATNQMP